MNRKTCVACNFDCCVEIDRLLKVTGSQVHCKTDNISERVHDTHVVTTDH